MAREHFYVLAPTQAKLQNDFTHHAPFGDQPERYENNRLGGLIMAQTLTLNCPPSAELTLALRKVQEAIFWANAAIALVEKEEEAAATEPPIDLTH